MREKILSSFFDELEKIAELQSGAAAAHELGHAQDFEQAGKHRKLGLNLIKTVGALTAFSGVALGKPSIAGIGGLAAGIPTLFEEGTASLRAIKALKNAGYSDQEVKSAKKHLVTAFNSYAVPLAVGTLGAMGSAAAIKATSSNFAENLLPILPYVGSILLGGYGAKKFSDKFKKDSKEFLIDLEKVNDLRSRMGVKAKIYEHGPKELYIAKGNPQKQIERVFGKALPAKEISRMGGVILQKGRYENPKDIKK